MASFLFRLSCLPLQITAGANHSWSMTATGSLSRLTGRKARPNGLTQETENEALSSGEYVSVGRNIFPFFHSQCMVIVFGFSLLQKLDVSRLLLHTTCLHIVHWMTNYRMQFKVVTNTIIHCHLHPLHSTHWPADFIWNYEWGNRR